MAASTQLIRVRTAGERPGSRSCGLSKAGTEVTGAALKTLRREYHLPSPKLDARAGPGDNHCRSPLKT